MSEQPHKDQLERINKQLTASLKNCRAIVRDCQRRLAANSNELGSISERGELDVS